MRLSLLQYAGHCAKCGVICLQCFVSANRQASHEGGIDRSDNRQLEMMGERIWDEVYEVLDVDVLGRPLENHAGMTCYGLSSGRLGYGLLLNSAALELAITEVQD